MGDKEKTLPILLKSFEYDSPRAEICCEIGYYYKKMKQYSAALKWFQIAANLGQPDNLGFVLWDYWGYIPNIECCVCCYHLNNCEQAMQFNERAALFKPNASAVKTNRAFLSDLIVL